MTTGRKIIRALVLIGLAIVMVGYYLWNLYTGHFGALLLAIEHNDWDLGWRYFLDVRNKIHILGGVLFVLGLVITFLAATVRCPITDKEDDESFDLYGKLFKLGTQVNATDCKLEYWAPGGKFIAEETLADVGMRALTITGQGPPEVINLRLHGMLFNVDMPELRDREGMPDST